MSEEIYFTSMNLESPKLISEMSHPAWQMGLQRLQDLLWERKYYHVLVIQKSSDGTISAKALQETPEEEWYFDEYVTFALDPNYKAQYPELSFALENESLCESEFYKWCNIPNISVQGKGNWTVSHGENNCSHEEFKDSEEACQYTVQLITEIL